MKIETKLPDPRYCADCPCIGVASFGYEELRCNLGYWDERWDAKKSKEILSGQIIRPRKCVKENGE